MWQINEDVRDGHISFALKDQDDPSEGSGVFIEVKRYKNPRRYAQSSTFQSLLTPCIPSIL
jgi:hypothetical protein